MKKLFAFAVVLAALMFTSCGVVKTPVTGMAYTKVKDGMTLGTSAAGSSKVGTATVKGYVGLVALGDASIEAAARSAGITRINHVDYESKSILGLYNVYTVIVYGD